MEINEESLTVIQAGNGEPGTGLPQWEGVLPLWLSMIDGTWK